MKRAHPRIVIVAGCVAHPRDNGEIVERVASDRQPAFWAHYVVGPDGRQVWQTDYDSRSDALAGARLGGARQIFLDDCGRLTATVKGVGRTLADRAANVRQGGWQGLEQGETDAGGPDP